MPELDIDDVTQVHIVFFLIAHGIKILLTPNIVKLPFSRYTSTFNSSTLLITISVVRNWLEDKLKIVLKRIRSDIYLTSYVVFNCIKSMVLVQGKILDFPTRLKLKNITPTMIIHALPINTSHYGPFIH